MALSEGYRSALASIGTQGGGLVGALSSGLSAGAQYAAGALETAAERRRKKQEEEKAREREGLTFALNQAIEAGDEEGIKRLGPQVYGGVDFGAVASAAKRKKEEADRSVARTRASELLTYIPYADADTQKELSNEIGRLTAQGLGLSPTIQVPTGEYDITPAMPGYGIGQEIPAAAAQAVETRGLGKALEPGMTGPDMRRVVAPVPAVAEVKTPRMEERPRFAGFGEKKVPLTPYQKAESLRRTLTYFQDAFKELSSPAQTAVGKEFRAYENSALAALSSLYEGIDVAIPKPPLLSGKTASAVKEEQATSLAEIRKSVMDSQKKLNELRAQLLPKSVGAQVTRAAAAMRSAGASESRAVTAANSLIETTKNRATKDQLTMWVQDQTNARKLADIDERGRRAGEAEAERKYPKKERERLPEGEREAWDKARQDVATVVADAYVAKETDRILKSVPRPALRVEAVGGAKPAPAKPAPAKPVPAPQRRAAPITNSGAGAFSGLAGARQ